LFSYKWTVQLAICIRLIEQGGGLHATKMKSGLTVTPDYIRAAQKAGRILGDEGREPWLIHGGQDAYVRSGVRLVGWRSLPTALAGA
jgi:hypothetical protein